jgi:transcriptional regulator GlxA family with amidase domain
MKAMASWRRNLLLVPALVCGASLSQNAAPRPVRAGILVYEDVYDTEFVAPLDVFRHAAPYTRNQLEAFTVAPRAGAVRTAEGLHFQPDYTFSTAPKIDWLIVPSGKNTDADIKNGQLITWIREVGRQAQIVQSNCDGAFLLGAAGLLDGRQATTYPSSLDRFAAMFPKVRVRRNVRFVDDQGIVTSPGGAMSFDAALYLLERGFGHSVTETVAGELLVEWNLQKIPHEVVPEASKK